jgi:hypothetical protein
VCGAWLAWQRLTPPPPAPPALASSIPGVCGSRLVVVSGRSPLICLCALWPCWLGFHVRDAWSRAVIEEARWLGQGVGSAANGPASQAYLADITSKFPKHRGALMGTLGSIGMLSYGVGPAVGGEELFSAYLVRGGAGHARPPLHPPTLARLARGDRPARRPRRAAAQACQSVSQSRTHARTQGCSRMCGAPARASGWWPGRHCSRRAWCAQLLSRCASIA